FFFQAEDGIRDGHVTGVQTCALPIFPTTLQRMVESADYRSMIAEVVRGMAERGPCVIVGHAAQMALQDQPGVLRVFVHAPAPVRSEERRVGKEGRAWLLGKG